MDDFFFFIKGTQLYLDIFEEYYETVQYKIENHALKLCPFDYYYIGAIFIENTDNIISNKLRLNLINNLNILSKDKNIKYDIRNGITGQYFHKNKKISKYITNTAEIQKNIMSVFYASSIVYFF